MDKSDIINMIKKNIKRKLILSMIMILVVVMCVSFVSAEFWLCMGKGERIDYCSNYKPSWTCPYDNGCEKCMSVYRESENCYVHGSWNKCNRVDKECSFGSNTTIDQTPPILTVNSPNNGDVFSSRKVLFDLFVDEYSSIYYIDNINGRGRWRRICSNCIGSYSKSLSFKDGLNDITIKAKDGAGNPVEVDREFYVDSKKPKIRKTYPKNGFANGIFEVEFDEENPRSLVLYYGDCEGGGCVGMREVVFDKQDIENEDNCELIKKKYYCEIEVDLDEYNEKEIEYWFELSDVADTKVESKHVWLEVDSSDPVIINDGKFWEQGEGRYAKYVYFNIEIDEPNFDEVSYFYIDSRGRMREKRLCSRLKNGICSAKKSFRNGEELLNIQVTDEAGNYAIGEIGLVVEY